MSTFKQMTQLYFSNGNLNSQWYIDEVLRPCVIPFNDDLVSNRYVKMTKTLSGKAIVRFNTF